jgi:hypothetical protein
LGGFGVESRETIDLMESTSNRHEEIYLPLSLYSMAVAMVLTVGGIFFAETGWWFEEISSLISRLAGILMLTGGLILFYYLLPAKRLIARFSPEAVEFRQRFVIPHSKKARLTSTAERIVLTGARFRYVTLLWIDTPQKSIKLAVPGPRANAGLVVNAIVEWARGKSIDISVVEKPDLRAKR